jgi:hypothetical protein
MQRRKSHFLDQDISNSKADSLTGREDREWNSFSSSCRYLFGNGLAVCCGKWPDLNKLTGIRDFVRSEATNKTEKVNLFWRTRERINHNLKQNTVIWQNMALMTLSLRYRTSHRLWHEDKKNFQRFLEIFWYKLTNFESLLDKIQVFRLKSTPDPWDHL